MEPQLTLSNVKQDQIHHPGRRSNFGCAYPLFTMRGKDSSSTYIAEASWDTLQNTLTLTLKGCNAVVVGKSTTIEYDSDCDHRLHGGKIQTNCFDSGKVQTASNSKILDGSDAEQTDVSAKKTQIKKCEKQAMQQNLSAGLQGLDVEQSLPFIKKQGYLKGPQCEQIMEQLEILQDNGKFAQHKLRRLVTTPRFTKRMGRVVLQLWLSLAGHHEHDPG